MNNNGKNTTMTMKKKSGLFLETLCLVVVVITAVAIVSTSAAPPPPPNSPPVWSDVPYPQLNSTIYQFPNASIASPVEAWYSLPSAFSDGVVQDMIPFVDGTNTMALVLGSASLWSFYPFPLVGEGSFLRLDQSLNVPIQIGSKLAADSVSGLAYLIQPSK